MDLGLGLENNVVIVTGGAGQIGSVIVEAFLSAGSKVASLDLRQRPENSQRERLLSLQVDVTNERDMMAAWDAVERELGMVPTVCICAAGLDLSFVDHHGSVADMSVEQFRRTLDVNVVGTFVASKLWLRGIREYEKSPAHKKEDTLSVSLVVIASEAGIFGVPGNADYAASKSALHGLILSLAPDAANVCSKARVNAVAPGPVNTPQFKKECSEEQGEEVAWLECKATVAMAKPVEMEDVARTCLMLASERWSSSTTGQMIRVDGGKSGRVYRDRSLNPTW